MKIKVCGLRDADNIHDVIKYQPDFVGFIFTPTSARYVADNDALKQIVLDLSIQKVGVFVNPILKDVLRTAEEYTLDFIQLHGDESPEFVQEVANHYPVIKAFSVDENFSFNLKEFGAATYFLFDAKGPLRGGNGIHFDWKLLEKYQGEIPFLLSGGIQLFHLEEIAKIQHEKLIGIDVNSGFEIYPGFKNPYLIKQLKEELYELSR